MNSICAAAEKATVMVSDSGGHVHGSPLVMVDGLAVSSHATLCFETVRHVPHL
jgi:hypothetical protein